MADENFVLGDEQVVIMDASEAMEIVQLPIIEERFALLRQQIQSEIDQALALECNEETVKEVKKARANLNSTFQKNYENARKEIKTKVLAPYNLFEELYKENVATQFKEADQKLGEKISEVENELKNRKRKEVEAYFNEYKAANGLSGEVLTLEDVGISITLSASLKSLKEACKRFLDNMASDIECINAHDDADEIMIEYRKTHSLSQSICTVEQRHEEIRKEHERMEALKQEQEVVLEHEDEMRDVLEEVEKEKEMFAPPKVEVQDSDPVGNEEYEVSFCVTGTLQEILMLRNFMDDLNLKWEQIN